KGTRRGARRIQRRGGRRCALHTATAAIRDADGEENGRKNDLRRERLRAATAAKYVEAHPRSSFMSRPYRTENLMLLLASVALTAPAFSDEAPAEPQAQEMEVLTVTGSRVKRDFASDSPIVSVGKDILTQTGTSNIEQVLNQLPQFVPSVTTTSNNPANGGQANIDLRG